MKRYISLFFKGVGMGAANIIPGVSGGTIALITGIFEELINSIKSFDLKAIKLLFSGKFKQFANYINLYFLLSVFLGIGICIISIAYFLEILFNNHRILVYAYFFGLIMASVYFVGKTIEKWSVSVIISFVLGTAVAIFISFLNHAPENESFIYLFICGIVAMCSMILPGLSGSFVLILLGNYELIFIKAINDVRINILIPVVLGAGFGLLAFSHLLSWIFKKFKNQTIGVLTGFILGSLTILWPWKEELYLKSDLGIQVLKSSGEPIIVVGERYLPNQINSEVLIAIGLILAGIFCIWAIEKIAEKQKA